RLDRAVAVEVVGGLGGGHPVVGAEVEVDAVDLEVVGDVVVAAVVVVGGHGARQLLQARDLAGGALPGGLADVRGGPVADVDRRGRPVGVVERGDGDGAAGHDHGGGEGTEDDGASCWHGGSSPVRGSAPRVRPEDEEGLTGG